jgi:hypothetical protein
LPTVRNQFFNPDKVYSLHVCSTSVHLLILGTGMCGVLVTPSQCIHLLSNDDNIMHIEVQKNPDLRFLNLRDWSPDSSVGIVTVYRLDGQGSIPGKDERFFSSL